jgi:hypothetical protein
MSSRTRSITAVSIALVVATIGWFGQRDRTQAQAPAIVSCKVLGFVRPAPGAQLDEKISLSFTDHLGRCEWANTDPAGAYSISGLAPGTWWVGCIANCGAEHTQIELVARQLERRLDLRLARRRAVRVRVTSTTGEPISVATLAAATLEDPGEWIDDADYGSTRPLGVGHFEAGDSYELPQSGAHIGSVVLDVEPPVFVSLVRYQRVLATQRIERLGQDAEFVIDPHSPLLDECSVRGRVVDATTRQPVTSAFVHVGGRMGGFGPQDVGQFKFQRLWPGRHRVAVMPKNGFAAVHIDVLLEPGATLDLGDIEVRAESWINGLVVDQQGHPLSEHFRIAALDGETAFPYPSSLDDHVTSDNDGSLHIGGLAPGRYLLKLARGKSLPKLAMIMLVDTNRGPVEGLRIEVVPGVDLVVRAASEAALGTHWIIRNSDGVPVISRDPLRLGPVAYTLAPGKYTVEVEMPNGAAPLVHEVVLASEPVELVLP